MKGISLINVVVIISVIIFVLLGILYLYWWYMNKDYAQIPWKIFYTGYLLNPQRYTFDTWASGGQVGVSDRDGAPVTYYSLGFIDSFRLSYMLHHQKATHSKNSQREEYQHFLEIVQKDVQEAIKVSENEMITAAKEIKENIKTLSMKGV